MYLQYQLSEKGADKKTYIVFYSILILYILSTAIIVLDVARDTGEVYLSHNSAGTNNNLFFSIRDSDSPVGLHMDQCISADVERQHSRFDFGYHDRLRRLYLSNYPSKHKPVNRHDTHQSCYLPKSPKIYRCWIVWNRNIRVVIIPSIFTLTFFGQSTYLFGMANFNFSLIAFSYLDSSCHISRSMGIFQAELLPWSSSGVAGESIVDMSRPILDRECYGDRLNSVQDHEGVLERQAHLV